MGSKCDECAKVKHPPRKPHAPLGGMPVGAPLDRLSTDILGPFPESNQGNKYVLAVTDILYQVGGDICNPRPKCSNMCEKSSLMK